MTKGHLYIISAPSGAGKTSLINALVPGVEKVQVSVSHTTRPKREQEREGQHYFFVDQATFLQMQTSQCFLESAQVFGYYYGTSRQAVDQALAEGQDVILEIDWQGARQVRKLYPESLGIFILPPSLQALKERLAQRGQDDAATINRRLALAQMEISHYADYDYLIVNDVFSESLQKLKAVLLAQRQSLPAQKQSQALLLASLLS
jgi:guanylate kinase